MKSSLGAKYNIQASLFWFFTIWAYTLVAIYSHRKGSIKSFSAEGEVMKAYLSWACTGGVDKSEHTPLKHEEPNKIMDIVTKSQLFPITTCIETSRDFIYKKIFVLHFVTMPSSTMGSSSVFLHLWKKKKHQSFSLSPLIKG